MFLLTTVVALGVSLFKEGGLFVVTGMLAAMLSLVGIAMALSQLRAAVAGMACAATLICLAVVAIVASERWYEVRARLSRFLGASLGDYDLLGFWACVMAATIALGATLGWAIAVSQERN